MLRSVKGKVALVTGAGRGIGRAIALRLGAEGAKVAVTDLDLEHAQIVAEQVGAHERARPFLLDVTDAARFKVVIEQVERELGPLEILVNNAGIMTLGRFLDHGAVQDDAQIDVNFHGVVHGMRAVLPRMKERGRGHIINIASVAGRVGTPFAAVYSATKFAVVGLTEAVRAEEIDSGVAFSYVLPALVDTELIAGAGRPRWPPVVHPDDVALGVLRALRTRRVDVYVPRVGGFAARLLPAILPRLALDRLGRALRVDRMFEQFDAKERGAYLERARRVETENHRASLRLVKPPEDPE